MKIRQEKPAEYQAVERLTYQAFKELNLTENWRPTEHFIVHLLRESADFIPELSLVSETDQGKLTVILCLQKPNYDYLIIQKRLF